MTSPTTLVLRQGRLRTPRDAGLFRSVLVPLDGSAFAEFALEWARAVASAVHAGLLLVRVHQGHRIDRLHSAEWDAMIRSDEELYLDRVTAQLEDVGIVDAATELLDGDVVEAICARAARLESPLVVMSSHGRTGLTRSWLGSVADGVIRGTTTPVMIVRPDAAARPVRGGAPACFENVIVALDGSSFAAQILPHAIGLADAMRAHLLLLRVVQDAVDDRLEDAEAYMTTVAERVRFVHAKLRVSCDVRVGRAPAAAIASCAAAAPHALVALATHGRGLSRYVVGSVADGVIRGAQAPVLVIRSTQT